MSFLKVPSIGSTPRRAAKSAAMSDGNRAIIQPVWGVTNRKLSYGVLDAAEHLLQNIDELSEVLDELREKYDKVQVSV